MDEFQIAVAGRFSALEFVLEVLMANNLATMDRQSSEHFKSEMLDREGYITHGPIDVDDLQAIAEETQAVLRAFLAKVSNREEDVRRGLQ